MSRTAGAVNKPKPLLEINEDMDSENLFLTELIRAKTFWTARAKDIKDKGGDNKLEIEIAEYYKLGINQFSKMDKPNTE
jgi:hypothetical protein